MIELSGIQLEMWQESVGNLLADPSVVEFTDAVSAHISQVRGLSPDAKQKLVEDFSQFTAHKGTTIGIDPKTYVNQMIETIRDGNFFFKLTADFLLPLQDVAMWDYANYWSEITDRHKKRGTYRKMHEFMGPATGLHLDIGTGAGGFLEDLETDSVLAIDLNHYLLREAEKRLQTKGKKVRRLSASYIAFDPRYGFVIKPCPIKNLDLSITNLVVDDAATLENTRTVLENGRTKADSASFALVRHGCHGNVLGFLKDYEPSDFDYTHLSRVAELCKSGARILAVYRSVARDPAGIPILGKSTEYASMLAEANPRIDVEKAELLVLGNENTNYYSVRDDNGIGSVKCAYMILARVR